MSPPVAYDADDQTLLRQVIDYYQERLQQTPAALEYLKKRGIDSADAIAAFKLGFADRTLGLRLPNKQRVAGADIRERLTRLGLYRESGHEHLNGCVVFPILSADGLHRRGLWPQDRGEPNPGSGKTPLSPRSAPGLVESGLPRLPGNHPLRGADRCADLLVRGF